MKKALKKLAVFLLWVLCVWVVFHAAYAWANVKACVQENCEECVMCRKPHPSRVMAGTEVFCWVMHEDELTAVCACTWVDPDGVWRMETKALACSDLYNGTGEPNEPVQVCHRFCPDKCVSCQWGGAFCYGKFAYPWEGCGCVKDFGRYAIEEASWVRCDLPYYEQPPAGPSTEVPPQ